MDDVDDVDLLELPGRTTGKSLWQPPNSLLQSPLFKAVKPFLKRNWDAALKNKFQIAAFLQLASLPKKNDIDKQWVEGVYKSNQATFKQLMSIFLHAVGSSSSRSSSSIDSILCSACETRGSLKRRNCRVLPPEAKDMRQLQDVIGQQCVNCYFFPTSKACEFPDTTKGPPAAVKQTPVPIPSLGQPTQSFSQPISRPSTAGSIASSTVAHPAPPRHQESPTKSAQNLARPISQTPIPVPPIPILTPKPTQPASRQSVLKQAQHVDAEQPVEDAVRQSSRLLNRPSQTSADSGSQTDPEPRLSGSRTSPAAAPSPGLLISHYPSAESAATSSLREASSAPSKSASLVAKAFSLFGEIGQLPTEEQAGVYQKLAELSEIARRPLVDAGLSAQFAPSAPVAEDWEIAPGCLLTRTPNGPFGFSSPFLRREVISFELAHQVSRSQRVLNNYLAPLAMAKVNGVVGEEGEGGRWECTLVVLEGFVKVKMQELEARVGQGGVLLVTAGSDCVVTNVGLRESRIQVRWTREW